MQPSKSTRNWVAIVVVAIALAALAAVSLAAGVLFAALSLKQVQLVDAHSGDLKEQIYIAGFLIREDNLPPTGFEIIPNRPSVSLDSRHWLIVSSFRGSSHIAGYTEGGVVLEVMNNISTSVSYLGLDTAIALKEDLLTRMASQPPMEASEEVDRRLIRLTMEAVGTPEK